MATERASHSGPLTAAAPDHSCDQPLGGSTAGDEVAGTLDGDRLGVGIATSDATGPLGMRATRRYDVGRYR